jgi:hypothetical protein
LNVFFASTLIFNSKIDIRLPNLSKTTPVFSVKMLDSKPLNTIYE